MASTRAFAVWKVVFFALLLLAFDVSARELVGTNVVARTARTAREMAVEMNGVMGMRLVSQVQDSPWKGSYHPPRWDKP